MNMFTSGCTKRLRELASGLLVLVVLVVFVVLVLLAAPLQAADPLRLLSRATQTAPALQPDAGQRQWLRDRQELRLGTSAPDYPPFDITLSGQDYEGITADYAGIVARALQLPVRVLRFESRGAAIDALKQGRIDLLGSANRFEAADSGISLSRPYATDQPVLVTRASENRPLSQTLSGLRLSMVYHYLPPEEVQARYPGAILQTHPSFQSAINAVAFGQADVFLGDSTSTRYIVHNGYLNNIRIARFGRHEAHGFGFAVRNDDTHLLGILDQVLQGIPVEVRHEIARRWSAGDDLLPNDPQLQLTPDEHAWIARHPRVRVVVDEADAPLSFTDNAGNLHGVTADLLDLLQLRTGLHFDIQRADGTQDMLRQLAQGHADLAGALLPTQARTAHLNFSRPYLDNSFVLVTRQGQGQPAQLQQFSGRRLAVAQADILQAWLAEQYPHIARTPFDTPAQALDLLLNGQVDGAVLPLFSASYLLSTPTYRQRLQITATVGETPALIALASRRDAPQLTSIIDKALLGITPRELASIHDRWRTWSSTADNHHDYRPLIYRIVIGASLLLLILLAWNTWMRRQIRQREIAERALNDQLEFMSTLVNGTPHPVYVRDRQGCLRMCNDSYLQTFAVHREQVIGQRVTDGVLSHPHEALEYAEDYRQVMASNTPLILDRTLHIGERRLTIYHWILPFHDSLGEVQGIIGGWIDISERRRLVEALQAAKEQADNASRAKSTFLATMSHEIRTPMNAVIGMLELALKRADQGHLDRQAIEVAHGSAKDLLELIGDILDIARIESGHLALNPERASVQQLSEAVVRMFDGLARQKRLSLQLVIGSGVEDDVLIDPLRFKQILSNLISNAIKFTPAGEVRVTLTAGGQSTREHLHLQLSVQDSGIGIDHIDRQRLFEPFAQANNTGQAARSGAGLGLVICRNLSRMMGGDLLLDSEPGQGTCVSLELMLERLTAAPGMTASPPPEHSAAHQALHILVVDDHPANRLLLSQQLAFLGHRCESAENGRQGLQHWQAMHFDLLMVDCNMPVMDGYQLTGAIRSQEQAQSRAPCIIWGFTANAQPEEVLRCRQAGMDDCLFKPIGLAALGEHLARLTPTDASRHPPTPHTQPENPPPFDPANIQRLTGDRPEMRQRLLNQLLDSCREDRQALARLNPAHERTALGEMAHRIKGAARIISATGLVTACEDLEQACMQAADSQVEACQRQLVHLMQVLEQQLQAQLDDAPT